MRAPSAGAEDSTDKACQELKGAQSIRSEAAAIRTRAQTVLDEMEAVHEDAERVVARTRSIFSKAAALNPEAQSSIASTIRTLEEAIRTERHLRQLTRQQAEEEAEWARKRATDAILSALSAVRKATNHVNRELGESKRVAATAESLKNSCLEDLKRARAILAQAESLMKREARKLLEQPSAEVTRPSGEPTVPPRTGPEEGSYRDPLLEGKAQGHSRGHRDVDSEQVPYSPPAGGPGADRQVPVIRDSEGETLPFQHPAVEPAAPVPQARPSARIEPEQLPPTGDQFSSGPVFDETARDAARTRPDISNGQPPPVRREEGEAVFTEELASSLNEFLRSTEAPQGVPVVRDAPQPPSEGLFLDNLDFSRTEPEVAQPPQEEVTPTLETERQPGPLGVSELPAAQGEAEFNDDLLQHLQQSLESVYRPDDSVEAPSHGTIQQPGGHVTRPDAQEPPGYSGQLQATPPVATSPPAPTPAPVQSAQPPAPTPPPAQSSPPPAPTPPSAKSSPPADSYSGTLSVVLAPAADVGTLSFFWDVIDSVAGAGKVIAQTALANGSGHEFTLDLGNDVLVIEQLNRRIPGAVVSALGPDRLQIELGETFG